MSHALAKDFFEVVEDHIIWLGALLLLTRLL